MNLNQLIDNHIQAIGGRDVVEGVHAIRVHFHVVEPSFELDGVYIADRHNRMRVDMYFGETRVFSEGYTGSVGWQLHQDEAQCLPTSPAGTAALMIGIDRQLFGLHEFQGRGHQLELLGTEQVDNADYFVIQIEYANGQVEKRYIHAESWLVERSREKKALHPDIDPTEVVLETTKFDFRTIDGLVRSFQDRQVNLATNELMQTTAVQTLEINPDLAPDSFDPPFPMGKEGA